tara:strand:+ start:183 stop:1517 length:1335 start_codon:yes stop_codon:yes gene_type:complete
MNIIQFQDKPLAHYSYALISNNEMAIVDPSRDPKPYYELAEKHNVKIKAVFETHPHADFVSGHLQIHKETSAEIYVSKLVKADYPHKTFDDGDTIKIGNITFSAINSPGHSPDSITIIANDEANNYVMFSGDTLFIGDVGRPDLREKADNKNAKREDLAKSMYYTIKNKFTHLPNATIIYPAHGAGSLCGKNMSDDSSSTLGKERKENWAFQDLSEDEFVSHILDDQPFIPSYFGFNVDLNKEGTANLEPTIDKIPFIENTEAKGLIVDAREESDFKKGHLKGSINIQAKTEASKFETWLGAIIKPKEAFTLVIDNKENKDNLLKRVAKIGYEKQVKQVITLSDKQLKQTAKLDLKDFKNNPDKYTIVDVRNKSEVEEGKFFDSAISRPLNELRKTASEISESKPIVVHCAGGYRSAAGSSIIQKELADVTVYDLSDAVEDFKD